MKLPLFSVAWKVDGAFLASDGDADAWEASVLDDFQLGSEAPERIRREEEEEIHDLENDGGVVEVYDSEHVHADSCEEEAMDRPGAVEISSDDDAANRGEQGRHGVCRAFLRRSGACPEKKRAREEADTMLGRAKWLRDDGGAAAKRPARVGFLSQRLLAAASPPCEEERKSKPAAKAQGFGASASPRDAEAGCCFAFAPAAAEVLRRCVERGLAPHQAHACETLLRGTSGRLLVHHGTGSGKTMTALAAAACLLAQSRGLRVFILTPRANVSHFAAENRSKKLGVDMKRVVVTTETGFHGLWRRRRDAGGGEGEAPYALFVDEAHGLRGGCVNGRASQRKARAASVMEASSGAVAVVLLTATPVMNGSEEFFNLFAMLTHGEAQPARCLRALRSPASWKRALAGRVSSWSSDAKAGFPSVEEERVELLLEGGELLQYMEREAQATLGTAAEELDKNPTVFLNLIRRSCSGTPSKVAYAARAAKENVARGEKTVIYSGWIDAGLRPLARELRRLAVSFVEITGSNTAEEIEASKEAYNAGRVKLLLLSNAGATGVDLKETEHVIVADVPWNENAVRQLVGRAARFNSHAALPPARQRVRVQRLLVVKPKPLPPNVGQVRVLSGDGLGVARWTHCGVVRHIYVETADEHLYKRSVDKDAEIRKFSEELRAVEGAAA